MHVTRAELLIVLAIILSFLSVTLQAFVPSPVRYDNIPFPVSPTIVAPGQTLAVTIVRCNGWPTTLTYQVVWELTTTGGTRIPLPGSIVKAPPGCQTGEAMLTVPEGIHAGVYHVVRITNVHTFVGTYDVPSESVPFTVTQ